MNIFVAKLHFSTDNDGLLAAFKQYGDVESAKVMMDRETGRSKCYGFVEMPDSDSGKKAISELDGSELDGATIVVKEATPREDRPGGGAKFGGGGGGGFNRSGGSGGGFNRGGSGGGGGFNRNNDRNSGGGGGKRW